MSYQKSLKMCHDALALGAILCGHRSKIDKVMDITRQFHI